MKVRLLKTGAVQEVNASYGARLIEQGKAVAVKAENRTKKATPDAHDAPKV